MKLDLEVGDTVIWRGGWGKDAPIEALVTSIDKVKPGEKYGDDVKSLPWSQVETRAVVALDNGHWAYGYQLSQK